MTPQAFESKVRRLARRHGFRLCKSRRRDPRFPDHGKYHLVDDYNIVRFGCTYCAFEATLDDCFEFLSDQAA